MGFSDYFSRQAGKPSGWFGRWVMSLVFDKGNTQLNALMKNCMTVKANDRILEIGCGTGKLIGEIVSVLNGGCVEGVEFSETMASMAVKRNKKAIDDGRAIIHLSDFNTIELKESTYDTVCSCNTIYFWSDPQFTIKKIHRVLKPSGKLAIAFEDKTRMEKKKISSDVFRFYSKEEFSELLKVGGFTQKIEIEEKPKSSGFCCIIAYK